MYDFKNAEIYLLDLFAGKPLIQLEVRMFQYSNAEAGSTYALRQKVKQEALTKEMMQAILKELNSTNRARACLELLETCVSFLQATGGAFVQVLDVGEKPLGEYVKNVLLLESAEFGSKIISEQVSSSLRLHCTALHCTALHRTAPSNVHVSKHFSCSDLLGVVETYRFVMEIIARFLCYGSVCRCLSKIPREIGCRFTRRARQNRRIIR
jgi:hypothetical protein